MINFDDYTNYLKWPILFKMVEVLDLEKQMHY